MSLTQTPQGPLGASHMTSVVLASNMNEKVSKFVLLIISILYWIVSLFTILVYFLFIPFLGFFTFLSPFFSCHKMISPHALFILFGMSYFADYLVYILLYK